MNEDRIDDALLVDMGGTSFDVSTVIFLKLPILTRDGRIKHLLRLEYICKNSRESGSFTMGAGGGSNRA